MFTMEIISGFDSTEFDYAHIIGICDPRIGGRIDSGSVELLCESSVHGYGVMDGRPDPRTGGSLDSRIGGIPDARTGARPDSRIGGRIDSRNG